MAQPLDDFGRLFRSGPETTLLYQIVQEYWPEFQAEPTRFQAQWVNLPGFHYMQV
jgi:hypothetical protein